MHTTLTPTTQPTREDRRRQLARLPKHRLCQMYRTGVSTPDGRIGQYLGGMYPPEKWTKDEVISSILAIEFSTYTPATAS